MTGSKIEGTVTGLWRFPVKSMKGEQITEAVVTEHGVLGDRAYALIDIETGKVVSAKSVKLFPDMFGCRAVYVEPPRHDGPLPAVEISLPNGSITRSDAGDVDDVLSGFFKRSVALAQVAPDDFSIDQYYPDIADTTPAGYRDTIASQKLGSALFVELGMESMFPVGSFFDLFPLSVLTTSTLAQLSEHSPATNFDLRRFRMNVIVATDRAGFVENDWVGKGIGMGEAVRLHVAMPDARCVMTVLAQDELSKDLDVLRTLVRHSRLPLGEGGKFPCAGVYAMVATAGTIRIGDPVTLD